MALCWELYLEVTQGTQTISSPPTYLLHLICLVSLCFHFSVVNQLCCCAHYHNSLENRCVKDEIESSVDY